MASNRGLKRERAAFICQHVFDKTNPVLLVSHEDDGAWQFLCGAPHARDDVPLVAHANHLVEGDATVAEVFDLPQGWEAERASVGAGWVRRRQGEPRAPGSVGGQTALNFSDLTDLVLKKAGSPCMLELQSALKAGSVSPASEPGRHPARRAASVFRKSVDVTAGVSCGFEGTVRALEALPEGDEVFLFGFSGPEQRFIVFVAAESNSIIGCVRVNQGTRSRAQP